MRSCLVPPPLCVLTYGLFFAFAFDGAYVPNVDMCGGPQATFLKKELLHLMEAIDELFRANQVRRSVGINQKI